MRWVPSSTASRANTSRRARGGDPIRNPLVLPTGKNMHALDPQAIPTAAACDCAKVVVDRLLERQVAENNGVYPESIAFVLWGTDNIKTYGESLAQVLWMVGVRPLPDSLGRVNQIEAIPLEELGRPRVDVVALARASSATFSSTR